MTKAEMTKADRARIARVMATCSLQAEACAPLPTTAARCTIIRIKR